MLDCYRFGQQSVERMQSASRPASFSPKLEPHRKTHPDLDDSSEVPRLSTTKSCTRHPKAMELAPEIGQHHGVHGIEFFFMYSFSLRGDISKAVMSSESSCGCSTTPTAAAPATTRSYRSNQTPHKSESLRPQDWSAERRLNLRVFFLNIQNQSSSPKLFISSSARPSPWSQQY